MFLYHVVSINTLSVLKYIHKPHLQPLPIKTMRTHLLWQKKALNEGIHVYNAFMVHRPGKLTNKAQRMLNILKVSLLLTMHVLIKNSSGQTFSNIKPGVFTCAYTHGGIHTDSKLYANVNLAT